MPVIKITIMAYPKKIVRRIHVLNMIVFLVIFYLLKCLDKSSADKYPLCLKYSGHLKKRVYSLLQ